MAFSLYHFLCMSFLIHALSSVSFPPCSFLRGIGEFREESASLPMQQFFSAKLLIHGTPPAAAPLQVSDLQAYGTCNAFCLSGKASCGTGSGVHAVDGGQNLISTSQGSAGRAMYALPRGFQEVGC